MRAGLIRGTAWLFVARVGTQLAMVLFTILIARRLGEAGLGEYAFVASAVFVANVLTSFGTDMLLIREIAARRDLTRAPAALVLQLGLSLVVVAIVLVGAPATPNVSDEALAALRVYAVALIPLSAYTVCTAALRGVGRMDTYTALNLAVAFAQLGAAFVLVPVGGSVVQVAALLLAVQAFGALLALALCRAAIPDLWGAWRSGTALLGPLARASAPIALLGALGMIYQRSSVFLITGLAGAAATGAFSAAARPVEASKTAHLAAFGALYPAFAEERAAPSGTGGHGAALRRSLWSLLALAVAASAAITLFADPLIPLLFGPGFERAVPALQVIAWILVPYTVSTYLSLALLAAERERPVAFALVVAIVLLVGLSAWWIPLAGVVGACWAALAAETAQAAVLVGLGRS